MTTFTRQWVEQSIQTEMGYIVSKKCSDGDYDAQQAYLNDNYDAIRAEAETNLKRGAAMIMRIVGQG